MVKIASTALIFFVLFLFSFRIDPKGATKKKASVIELQFGDKSFVFSRLAKPGKISVFILSTSWCAPCHALKSSFEEAFKKGRFSGADLDVFYCSLSGDKYHNFEELDQNKGYINLKEIDRLTAEFPTNYILSPTTNCFTIISGNYPDSLFSILDELILRKNKFFSLENLQLAPKQASPRSGNIIDSLKNKIHLMHDSIAFLSRYTDSLQKIIENK